MRSIFSWPIAIGLVGLFVVLSRTQTDPQVVSAQTRKPVVITRLFTGPDGLTHAEEMEIKMSGDPLNEISEMFKVTHAEIHRLAVGRVNDWHTAPRRQFVITLSGRGEIEVSGGKKIALGPGSIELAEDLTGKGHITRVVGNQERVTIQLPFVDQSRR